MAGFNSFCNDVSGRGKYPPSLTVFVRRGQDIKWPSVQGRGYGTRFFQVSGPSRERRKTSNSRANKLDGNHGLPKRDSSTRRGHPPPEAAGFGVKPSIRRSMEYEWEKYGHKGVARDRVRWIAVKAALYRAGIIHFRRHSIGRGQRLEITRAYI